MAPSQGEGSGRNRITGPRETAGGVWLLAVRLGLWAQAGGAPTLGGEAAKVRGESWEDEAGEASGKCQG